MSCTPTQAGSGLSPDRAGLVGYPDLFHSCLNQVIWVCSNNATARAWVCKHCILGVLLRYMGPWVAPACQLCGSESASS